MLNHIVIMGRLTRDPELRYTQSQTPVVSFSVAVDRDFGGRDGGEKQTDFIDCVAWRSTAEFVSKYFRKGSMVVVSGRLQIRDWQDRDGNKRRSAEVVADNVYFGESRRREDDNRDSYGAGNYAGSSYGGNSYDSNRGASAPARSGFEELSDDDGELPFLFWRQREPRTRSASDGSFPHAFVVFSRSTQNTASKKCFLPEKKSLASRIRRRAPRSLCPSK